MQLNIPKMKGGYISIKKKNDQGHHNVRSLGLLYYPGFKVQCTSLSTDQPATIHEEINTRYLSSELGGKMLFLLLLLIYQKYIAAQLNKNCSILYRCSSRARTNN